jgi:hypothetical protein
MYCPNCASPIDNVKFCRTCGANVSLVPMALSGRLPAAEEDDRDDRRHKKQEKASLEGAWRSIFAGLGFIVVAFAVMKFFPGGAFWWFWLLIPAFGAIGSGVGQLMRLRSERQAATIVMPEMRVAVPAAPPTPAIQAPTTSQLEPPPSVVEDTTKQLEQAQRR